MRRHAGRAAPPGETSSSKAHKSETAGGAGAPATVAVKVFDSIKDTERTIRLPRATKLGFWMAAYVQKMGHCEETRFIHENDDGEWLLSPYKTPDEMKMEDGDDIRVQAPMGGC